MPTLEAWFTAYLAKAHARQGHFGNARRLATQAEAQARGLGFAYGLGVSLRALARIDRVDGAGQDEARRLTEALGTFSAIEARYEVARTHLDLATATHATGDLAAASRHLVEARVLFEVLGVPRYTARAAGLARELAV
jgi:hypothetical protein